MVEMVAGEATSYAAGIHNYGHFFTSSSENMSLRKPVNPVQATCALAQTVMM